MVSVAVKPDSAEVDVEVAHGPRGFAAFAAVRVSCDVEVAEPVRGPGEQIVQGSPVAVVGFSSQLTRVHAEGLEGGDVGGRKGVDEHGGQGAGGGEVELDAFAGSHRDDHRSAACGDERVVLVLAGAHVGEVLGVRSREHVQEVFELGGEPVSLGQARSGE